MTTDADDLRRTLERRQYQTVFQPVLSLRTGTVAGVEALTRFTRSSRRPSEWFAAAHAAGKGVELEAATAAQALAAAHLLPESVVLWINLSPAVLTDAAVVSLLDACANARVGIQMTGRIDGIDLDSLGEVVRHVQNNGAQVSIAGRLAVGLARSPRPPLVPDQVRAGIDTTLGLDRRRGRVRAGRIVTAAGWLGARVLADGLETPGQLGHWAAAGADEAQGFLIGTPAPLQHALCTHPIIPDAAPASWPAADTSMGQRGGDRVRTGSHHPANATTGTRRRVLTGHSGQPDSGTAHRASS